MAQVDRADALTSDQISDLIDDFTESDQFGNFGDNIDYFKGQNPHIMERKIPDDSGPDNRIPVSYARRIINTVVGYMYKPGLISYGFEDDSATYQDAITEVFNFNREPIKSEQVGKQASIQGIGYEFHYVDGVTDGKLPAKPMPRFVKLPVREVIPIYDWNIERDLWAFIRFFMREKEQHVFVYYDKRWVEYRKKEHGGIIAQVDEGIHYYGQVPLTIYENNEELMGDFDAVEPLIDAYDILMSDSMNEFDRFAWAYLLLKGANLSGTDASNLKRVRILENLDKDAVVEFLTKVIDTEFIKFMSDLVRAEIHRQAGIPNLEDYKFGSSASGETLAKFIYLMELFTDPKESYFKEGLHGRLDLVTKILNLRGIQGDAQDVEIIMNRNTPEDDLYNAQVFNAYVGQISRKTLIENYANFVKDADKELAAIDAEGFRDVEDFVEEPNAEA